MAATPFMPPISGRGSLASVQGGFPDGGAILETAAQRRNDTGQEGISRNNARGQRFSEFLSAASGTNPWPPFTRSSTSTTLEARQRVLPAQNAHVSYFAYLAATSSSYAHPFILRTSSPTTTRDLPAAQAQRRSRGRRVPCWAYLEELSSWRRSIWVWLGHVRNNDILLTERYEGSSYQDHGARQWVARRHSSGRQGIAASG